MDMDDAARLAGDYLAAEFAALTAVMAEPDDALVADAVTVAARFLRSAPDRPLIFSINRMPGPSAESLAQTRAQLAQYQARTLFQVKEYQHPTWGRLFGAYAGSRARDVAGAYERLYYLADADGTPGLIAEYVPELLAPAPPVTWSRLQGAEIDDPGELVAVRQLAEPTRKAHLEDYRAAASP